MRIYIYVCVCECTYKDRHHVHAMGFDNVRIPVALLELVKVRVEDVQNDAPMVDGTGTLLPSRAWRHSGHEILVVFFRLFDKGHEFLLVSEKNLPPRFERGTTTPYAVYVRTGALGFGTPRRSRDRSRLRVRPSRWTTRNFLYQVNAKGYIRYQHISLSYPSRFSSFQ
jgi:hypothetical protein